MLTGNEIKTSATSRFLADFLNTARQEMLIDILRAIIDDSQYKTRFHNMELIAGAQQEAINQLLAICHIWRGELIEAKLIKYNPHRKTLLKIAGMKGDIDTFIVFLLAKYWSFLGSAAIKISKDHK